MGKIAEYLRSHLDGEITDASDVRAHFSQDASVFSILPEAVVYPASEQDIRKVARFAWQLAEKGRKIGITSRGLGADWSGGAIGDSIVLALSAHLNKIIEMDSKKGDCTVEAGANVDKVNQALLTHGLSLAYAPIGSEYSSVGGVIATNGSGPRSSKYGSVSKNTKSLRVVLSNGDVIQTGRISKRDFRKKMGLATFEGEIYRGLDAIMQENAEAIAAYTGIPEYAPLNIFDIRAKDGSVDLTNLFIGAQGTLGIITEAKTAFNAYNPDYYQVVLGIEDIQHLATLDKELMKIDPSIYTVIGKETLQLFASLNPMYVGKRFGENLPEYLVLLEFDDFAQRLRKRSLRKMQKFAEKTSSSIHFSTGHKQHHELQKFFRIVSVLLQSEIEQARVVPVIDSAHVSFSEYQKTHTDLLEIAKKTGARTIAWYDAGVGLYYSMAYLDLRQLGQRQKLARLTEQHCLAIITNGGSVGVQGGGRTTAVYHKAICGDVLYGVMEKVKQLFDPYNILNPGVKFNVDPKALSTKVSHGYSNGYRHNFIPSDS